MVSRRRSSTRIVAGLLITLTAGHPMPARAQVAPSSSPAVAEEARAAARDKSTEGIFLLGALAGLPLAAAGTFLLLSSSGTAPAPVYAVAGLGFGSAVYLSAQDEAPPDSILRRYTGPERELFEQEYRKHLTRNRQGAMFRGMLTGLAVGVGLLMFVPRGT